MPNSSYIPIFLRQLSVFYSLLSLKPFSQDESFAEKKKKGGYVRGAGDGYGLARDCPENQDMHTRKESKIKIQIKLCIPDNRQEEEGFPHFSEIHFRSRDQENDDTDDEDGWW